MTAPFVSNLMRQTATYWPPSSNDGFGNVAHGAPVVLKCRWQDQIELAIDPQGEEFVSHTIVYPDRALAVQGFIALGDSSSEADPTVLEHAFEIRQVGVSPALKNDKELHKAWL
jgi:hypothetical protein